MPTDSPLTEENVTYMPPIDEIRRWEDHPAASGYVPVHPVTLLAIADELSRLSCARKCQECRQEQDDDWGYCPYCGKKQS